MKTTKNMIERIKDFYKNNIINPSISELTGLRYFIITQVRIFILAIRGFIDDKASIRASALTFYTLLSVVPIVAMGFGVAKGFGFQEVLETFIIENFRGQEEVMKWIIDLSETVLENVEGGLLAGIGLVVLVWSVMQVLNNIEGSFNAIWQVKTSRPFLRKLSDYLAMMLIAPFLIILSSSVMIYISTRVQTFGNELNVIHALSPYFQKLISLVPYTLVWLLFTILYMVMPNTKVKLEYALIAGIIAGTLFQLTQWAYIYFQVGVSQYSALYGTFAALPLFLAWLQISWLIVLLGAEISFAYQNIENYEFESSSLNLSTNQKRLLSLVVMHHIIKNFMEGKVPMTSSMISHTLGIPIRLVRDILFNLKEAHLVIETMTESPKEAGYTPGIDINLIDINMVLDRLDNIGSDALKINAIESYLKMESIQQNLMKSIDSNHNALLKDV
jgi:membrane protein